MRERSPGEKRTKFVGPLQCLQRGSGVPGEALNVWPELRFEARQYWVGHHQPAARAVGTRAGRRSSRRRASSTRSGSERIDVEWKVAATLELDPGAFKDPARLVKSLAEKSLTL